MTANPFRTWPANYLETKDKFSPLAWLGLLSVTFGLDLVTKLHDYTKNRLPMMLSDRLLLRKHTNVESVIDQLNNISKMSIPAIVVCATLLLICDAG